MSNKRKPLSFTKRHRVFLKTKGLCFYCGADLTEVAWEVDHKTPVASGGSDEFENLFATCCSCNRLKKNRDVEEFREWLMERSLNEINKCRFATSKLKKYGVRELDKIDVLLSEAGAMIVNVDIVFHFEKGGAK